MPFQTIVKTGIRCLSSSTRHSGQKVLKPYQFFLKKGSKSPTFLMLASFLTFGSTYGILFMVYNLWTGSDIDIMKNTKYFPWEEVKPDEQRNMFVLDKSVMTVDPELVKMREMLGKQKRY